MENKRLALLIAMVQALQRHGKRKLELGDVRSRPRSGPAQLNEVFNRRGQRRKGLWAFGTGEGKTGFSSSSILGDPDYLRSSLCRSSIKRFKFVINQSNGPD